MFRKNETGGNGIDIHYFAPVRASVGGGGVGGGEPEGGNKSNSI